MSMGSFNTWRTRRVAVSNTDGSLGVGTKYTALENLSTMIGMVVLPSERGIPGTKSKEI